MTRSDLIELAGKAGFGQLLTGDGLPTMWHGTDLGMLERFAGLVATAEREACASLLEDNARCCGEESTLRLILETNAAAIRSRSNV